MLLDIALKLNFFRILTETQTLCKLFGKIDLKTKKPGQQNRMSIKIFRRLWRQRQCVCVSIFTYVCLSACVCVCKCIYVCLFVCLSVCIYICMSCLWVCKCKYKCIYICMSVCVCVCAARVCVCLCVREWQRMKRKTVIQFLESLIVFTYPQGLSPPLPMSTLLLAS